MKLSVISRWYNEAALARLWCEHYLSEGASALYIVIDLDTDDDCAKIAEHYGAKIIRAPAYDGFDEAAKMASVNAVAATIEEGYILVADADEFAYSLETSLLGHLDRYLASCHKVQYWQAYQHATEGPIDERPALTQRHHGSADPFGQGLDHWCKPAIVAACFRPQWGPGHHCLISAPPASVKNDLYGAHWAMADVDLAIKRRLRARARMSRRNYQTGMTSHNWHITEAEIRRECTLHLYDEAQI